MAKIMLVEDDNNLREIYGARLLAEGHEIVAAKDGEEALAIAVKEKPDLIISDVMMPRISGFDMLDILRNAPETKETKVIMMTALSQAEDKARADQLGADRYLVKSQVTLEDVAHVVKDVLEGKSEPTNVGALPAEPLVDEAATPEAPVAAQSSETELPAAPSAPAPEPVTETAESTTETPEPGPTPAVPETLPEPVQTTSPASTPDPFAASDPTTTDDPPAVDPTGSSTPHIADPVTSEEPEAQDPVATPTSAPSTPDPAPVTPITVQLPPEAGAETATATPTPTIPAAQPEEPEAEPTAPVIGPNLMEALQHEEEVSTESFKPANTSSASSAPVNEPAIINGAHEVGIVQPTTPQDSTSEPEEETAPEAPAAEPTSSFDEDENRKKLVIKPINDPTKPDLSQLLAAEEAKAAVVNPEAASVINPAIEPPADAPGGIGATVQPAAPAPTNEHDTISL